jgi:hypothetical protein
METEMDELRQYHPAILPCLTASERQLKHPCL